MGADLYLRSISDKTRAEYQPMFDEAVKARDACTDPAVKDELQKKVYEVYDKMFSDEGYFRDSYNDTSLFWVMNLSWWNDVGDMLDNEGKLPLRNTKKLLKMIEERPITRERVEQVFSERKLGDTVDEWFDHWTAKRQRFIDMLKRSIRMKEPIACSI